MFNLGSSGLDQVRGLLWKGYRVPPVVPALSPKLRTPQLFASRHFQENGVVVSQAAVTPLVSGWKMLPGTPAHE